MYVVRSQVKKLAKAKGKRVSKSYYEYLDRRVHKMVEYHIQLLGSRATLNSDDAVALDAYKMTRS